MRELGFSHRSGQYRRRRHRAGPSARRHRRAHRRQGGDACSSARGANTRWPPNASAAARASPPFWRLCDGEIKQSRRHRRRRDGRRHRRAGRQCGRPRAAARYRCRRAATNRNARRRRRGRENAENRPGAVHEQRSGQARRLPAISRTIWSACAIATGSSKWSSERLDVKQALYARSTRCARSRHGDRLLQHLDHSAWPS